MYRKYLFSIISLKKNIHLVTQSLLTDATSVLQQELKSKKKHFLKFMSKIKITVE
jgi:hypothetical protein